jgi:hypothetical protein
MEYIITESQLKLLMENDLESFYEKNKDLIDRYNYLKDKEEEKQHRINPNFTLSVINKNTNPQILAKVKWPFSYKGKESKTGYLSISIGGPKQFPEMLNTPNIYEISKDIISQKLEKHNPFEFNLI